jgi:RNA polymerase sigma-70 factor (ECF subfamily)
MENPAPDGGDYEKFTGLLARHHAPLMSFILSLLPHWADAEDILQQASVVMWRKFAEFRPGTSFLAWGCQIARYLVLNHVRKNTRDPHVFSDELVEVLAKEALEDVDRLQAQRAALGQCLQKLDARSRKLIARCYEAGASIKDAAAQLGATPNSVYKTLNRLRETLVECVRRSGAGEPA